jgi:hypothetical protein
MKTPDSMIPNGAYRLVSTFKRPSTVTIANVHTNSRSVAWGCKKRDETHDETVTQADPPDSSLSSNDALDNIGRCAMSGQHRSAIKEFYEVAGCPPYLVLPWHTRTLEHNDSISTVSRGKCDATR